MIRIRYTVVKCYKQCCGSGIFIPGSGKNERAEKLKFIFIFWHVENTLLNGCTGTVGS